MVAQSRVYLSVCKIWPRSGDISFTKIFKKHFVRMYKSTPSSAFLRKMIFSPNLMKIHTWVYITRLIRSIMSKIDFGHQRALLHVFFLGFWLLFQTFFTITFISDPYDDIFMMKTIDQMYNFSEPNCALWVTFEAAHVAP